MAPYIVAGAGAPVHASRKPGQPAKDLQLGLLDDTKQQQDQEHRGKKEKIGYYTIVGIGRRYALVVRTASAVAK